MGIPDVVFTHPLLAEITGVPLEGALKKQVDGLSLVPLLKDPNADWPDRLLVTHVGRWPYGQARKFKYKRCSIQNARWTLVNNEELYDLKNDPGETKNVIAEHPDVVARLRAAYDQWWAECLPLMVNEYVIGPKINPMKALYWKQFGGGPDAQMLQRMNPERKKGNKY
jgi:arylsulfatase